MQAECEETGELGRVLAWRELEATRFGLPPQEAEVFAYSEGDLHRLEDLILDGCPPSVAFAIVS